MNRIHKPSHHGLAGRLSACLALALLLAGPAVSSAQSRKSPSDRLIDRHRVTDRGKVNTDRLDRTRQRPNDTRRVNPGLLDRTRRDVVVTEGTTLQVRLNLGDHASPWKKAVNITGSETVQFLWSTSTLGATGGSWRIVSNTGQLVATGVAPVASAPGKPALFFVDFGKLAPHRSYKVTITPRLGSGRRSNAPSASVIVVRVGANTPTVFDPAGLIGTLEEEVEKIRRKYKVPALGGALVTEKGVVSIAASGVRKLGDSMPVSHADKWHLGSDTKAMTAALVTVMIAKGVVPNNKLSWGTTVAEVFPEFREDMHPDFKRVTLEALLANRSGVTAPNADENCALKDPDHGIMTRRREFTRLITERDHSGVVGETYSYQNVNFIIAGAMLERLTGKSWESLMRQHLFQPLGMHSAGFGPVSNGRGRPLQPWGHINSTPDNTDNTPALGPAGTVHATLGDWAKFLKFQFTGSEGNLHIGLARMRAIQRAWPADDMTRYGFGWGVGRDGKLGLMLSHDGSNTKWYCHTQVFPEAKMAILTVSNVGGDIRDGSGRIVRDHGNGDQACFALRNHLRLRSGR